MTSTDAVAFGGDFRDDVLHVVRREELALLHVDRLAGARGRDEEIGLPRQERRDLQDVDDRRRCRRVRGLVDVGEHRQPGPAPDLAKGREPGLQAGTAERGARRPVGLVVGRLEDDRHAAPCRDLLDLGRRLERMLRALDDARAQDEGERVPAADGEGAHLDRFHGPILVDCTTEPVGPLDAAPPESANLRPWRLRG